MNEEQNNLKRNIFLNKKRKKSKSKRKRKFRSCFSPLIDANPFILKTQVEEKNIDVIRNNIRHFFNFNWENDRLEKKSLKIGKFLDSSVYWYLINSSYFSENNLYNNINKIFDGYLEKSSSDIIPGNINKELNNPDNFDNIINNKKNGDYLNNKNKNINLDKAIISIICCLDPLKNEKRNKYNKFQSIFFHESVNKYFNSVKNYLLNAIQFINKKNVERRNDLKKIAESIQEKYNSKNPVNNTVNENKYLNEDYIEENFMYSKKKTSLMIREKFWNYLYKKEKDYLLKRESKNAKESESKTEEEEGEENVSNNCYICNCGDLGKYDIFYECIDCGIKVHQECYGSKSNTEQKNWKCSKCKKMSIQEAQNLECFLCPCRGGAMKQTKISKESYFYKTLMKYRAKIKEDIIFNKNIDIVKNDSLNNIYLDNPWIHLTCAFGNKDIKLNNFGYKKNFKFEENNILEKYNSYCDLCKLNNCGPTLKCKNNDCKINCHPECARKNAYYIEIENYHLDFYCHKHRPNRFLKYFIKLSKSYNDDIYFFGDALDCVYKLFEQSKMINNKNNKIKQKKKFLRTITKSHKNRKKENIYKVNSKDIVDKDEIFENKNGVIVRKTKLNNFSVKNDFEFNKNERCFSHSYKMKKEKNISTGNSNNDIYSSNIIKDTNNNNNNNNSINNSKSLTECESELTNPPNTNKEFKNYILKFLDNNRIILNKCDGNYTFLTKEEKEEFINDHLEDFSYEKLKEEKLEISNNNKDNILYNKESKNRNGLISEERFEANKNLTKIKEIEKTIGLMDTIDSYKKYEKNKSKKRVSKSKYKK